MLIRNLISAVRQNLNSYSLDNYISGEYIYDVALSYSKLLIKRESDSGKIFKNTSFFKKIDCVEMETVPISSCSVLIPKCKTIQKSKEKLPNVYVSNYGSLMMIFNILRDKEYKEVNPIVFKNQQNQEFKPKHGFFWIENDHLFIPNSNVEVVSILGLFSDLFELNKKEKCFKILEQDFPTLPYLESTIIELTTNQIINSVKIPSDEDSNINSIDKV